MPLGDSITGSTCWRARLWQMLRQSGRTNFHFVGTLDTSGDCSDPQYEGHNEGHGGYLVTDLVGSRPHASEPATWFTSNPADIVLMHFGTNDVWNNIAPATILSAYTSVITELRKHSPNVIIVAAQIIPMNPTASTCTTNCACPQCGGRVQILDGQIPGWAASNSTPTSPIIVVDQWASFDPNADTKDGVHPNDTTGSQKMATVWFNALVRLF
jgi:mannan endo-1,4-beta-mannosidase